MKCIAIINADLQKSPLGTRSRLPETLNGEPILRHTIHRARAAKRISEICLVVPPDQQPVFRDMLHDMALRFIVQPNTPPHAALVRAGRWWAIDGWRGGIGGLCAFDEDFDCASAAPAAMQSSADLVACIPAAAPLFDPELLDVMIAHHEQNAEQLRLTFTQAPPGLSALLISTSLLQELAPTGQPPGSLLIYQPDRPFADLSGKEACYRAASPIIHARGRLIADTHRSMARVSEIFASGGADWDARRICEWLNQRGGKDAEGFPEEIEIELTTDEVAGESGMLRPRCPEVPRRGPIEMHFIEVIGRSLTKMDDVRIVLGGFGEPLLHPQFIEICQLFRVAGAASIAVRTGGRVCNAAIEEALFSIPVDVLEITMDASTTQTYSRVHGTEAYEQVRAYVEGALSRRQSQRRVLPLVVPSFMKSTENLDDMEDFFDHWQRRCGMALISGYSHLAGQRGALAVTSTAPPQREPCRRSNTRMMILADGSATTCDQDYKGVQRVGNLASHSLRDLWNGEKFSALRTQVIADPPLCAGCTEWHRQ